MPTVHRAYVRSGDTFPINIQKGTMKMPSKQDIPVICVGPGTGVAPMRALLEERVVNDNHGEPTIYYHSLILTYDITSEHPVLWMPVREK
jgi:sulfite reductase alpha subunit-like flavoprotein